MRGEYPGTADEVGYLWEVVEFVALNHAGLSRRDIHGIDRIETSYEPRFDVTASMRRVAASSPGKVVSVASTVAGVIAGVVASTRVGYASVGVAIVVVAVVAYLIREHSPDHWFEHPPPVKQRTHVYEPGMSQAELMRWVEYARLADEIRAENLEDDGFEFVG